MAGFDKATAYAVKKEGLDKHKLSSGNLRKGRTGFD